jgi:hypothetical protein
MTGLTRWDWLAAVLMAISFLLMSAALVVGLAMVAAIAELLP